jgi:hypothetical protein
MKFNIGDAVIVTSRKKGQRGLGSATVTKADDRKVVLDNEMIFEQESGREWGRDARDSWSAKIAKII